MKEIERSGGGCSLQGKETEGDTKGERERPLHPSWLPRGPAVCCADRLSYPAVASQVPTVNGTISDGTSSG